MDHANSSQNLGHGHSRRSGGVSGNADLSYDNFNNSASSMEMSHAGNSAYSMTNLDLGGQALEPIPHGNNPGDISLQTAQNMEVRKNFILI